MSIKELQFEYGKILSAIVYIKSNDVPKIHYTIQSTVFCSLEENFMKPRFFPSNIYYGLTKVQKRHLKKILQHILKIYTYNYTNQLLLPGEENLSLWITEKDIETYFPTARERISVKEWLTLKLNEYSLTYEF